MNHAYFQGKQNYKDVMDCKVQLKYLSVTRLEIFKGRIKEGLNLIVVRVNILPLKQL